MATHSQIGQLVHHLVLPTTWPRANLVRTTGPFVCLLSPFYRQED